MDITQDDLCKYSTKLKAEQNKPKQNQKQKLKETKIKRAGDVILPSQLPLCRGEGFLGTN